MTSHGIGIIIIASFFYGMMGGCKVRKKHAPREGQTPSVVTTISGVEKDILANEHLAYALYCHDDPSKKLMDKHMAAVLDLKMNPASISSSGDVPVKLFELPYFSTLQNPYCEMRISSFENDLDESKGFRFLTNNLPQFYKSHKSQLNLKAGVFQFRVYPTYRLVGEGLRTVEIGVIFSESRNDQLFWNVTLECIKNHEYFLGDRQQVEVSRHGKIIPVFFQLRASLAEDTEVYCKNILAGPKNHPNILKGQLQNPFVLKKSTPLNQKIEEKIYLQGLEFTSGNTDESQRIPVEKNYR